MIRQHSLIYDCLCIGLKPKINGNRFTLEVTRCYLRFASKFNQPLRCILIEQKSGAVP